MCEEKLSGLGILSNETDRAASVKFNKKKKINNFAEKKLAHEISIEHVICTYVISSYFVCNLNFNKNR